MKLGHWFIVPDLEGPISGGTLYNRGLLGALRDAGIRAAAVALEEGGARLTSGEPGWFWLDSLYLEALPALARAKTKGHTLGLLAHYLPSLLTSGDDLSRADLGAAEASALDHSDAFLVPSAFMAGVLRRLHADPVLVVEPGLPTRSAVESRAGADLAAVLVANLVPNKGVEPLLGALAAELCAEDRFTLTLIGSTTHDAAYARACARACQLPPLRERVTLLGAQTPSATLERMAQSQLAISASRMESYGMALAEARALGLPIVARRAGNVAAHVAVEAGGELVDDDRALARSCARLCRDREEYARRLERAQRSKPAPRSWSRAADDYVAQLLQFGEPRASGFGV